MSGVMASVDQRTQLAGRNRLELLMFRLGGRQLYAINVFKVTENMRVATYQFISQVSDNVGNSEIVHFAGHLGEASRAYRIG